MRADCDKCVDVLVDKACQSLGEAVSLEHERQLVERAHVARLHADRARVDIVEEELEGVRLNERLLVMMRMMVARRPLDLNCVVVLALLDKGSLIVFLIK